MYITRHLMVLVFLLAYHESTPLAQKGDKDFVLVTGLILRWGVISQWHLISDIESYGHLFLTTDSEVIWDL